MSDELPIESIADLIYAGLKPADFDGLSARVSEDRDRESDIDCRIQTIDMTKDALTCEVFDYRTN